MKVDFKLIGLILFIVIATLGSIYFFSGLKEDKRSSQTDILSLVPADTKSILQINSFGEFLVHFNRSITINPSNYKLFNWLPILSRMIVPQMKKSNSFFQAGRNTLLVSFHENGEVFYIKMHPREMNAWRKMLEEEVFPSFPPMVQEYKGSSIHHYPLNDNRFFSSVMKDGIFVGSFNLKLLQQVMNSWETGASVKEDKNFTHIVQTTGKTAVANLFHYLVAEEYLFVKDISQPSEAVFNGWTNSDITFSGNEIWLSGFYQPATPVSFVAASYLHNEDMELPASLIPQETFFLRGRNIIPVAPEHQGEKESMQLYTLYIADSLANTMLKINCMKIPEEESSAGGFEQYLKDKHSYRYRKSYFSPAASAFFCPEQRRYTERYGRGFCFYRPYSLFRDFRE